MLFIGTVGVYTSNGSSGCRSPDSRLIPESPARNRTKKSAVPASSTGTAGTILFF